MRRSRNSQPSSRGGSLGKGTIRIQAVSTRIDDPFLLVQSIHEFFNPGQHLSNFWLDQIPKKLIEELECSRSGVYSIGWGIHIVEGPDWF
jgi:hypothetical protein